MNPAAHEREIASARSLFHPPQLWKSSGRPVSAVAQELGLCPRSSSYCWLAFHFSTADAQDLLRPALMAVGDEAQLSTSIDECYVHADAHPLCGLILMPSTKGSGGATRFSFSKITMRGA